MPSPGDLYTAPASKVDYELVRAFVLNAEEASLFSESATFEAKEKRDKGNVAEAVAALSNTDGGVILVGVKDKDATGEDRIVVFQSPSMTRWPATCTHSSPRRCRRSSRWPCPTDRRHRLDRPGMEDPAVTGLQY